MLTSMAQYMAQSSFAMDWMKFKTNTHDLKKVQQAVLEKILKDHPFINGTDDFKRAPVRNYLRLNSLLAEKNYTAKRYQPTSGSGDREKLIPYTSGFISELNRALNPWLFDTGLKYPGILKGKHYWSTSWLPTHYRVKNWNLDDFDLLPAWKKNLTRLMMAVPNEVSKAKTLEASQFATLAFLLGTPDLTFLSVWSPTFLLQLLELETKWKESLIKTLRDGKWAKFQDELSTIPAPLSPYQAKLSETCNWKMIWPHLALISSWNSSTSSQWAKKLHGKFPQAAFQGKGLWATEGVVTIPFEGRFVLSYQSHFYEFFNLQSGDLVPSWELKEGMEVHPVMTCGNGFVRYNLKDRMTVTGFHNSLPALEFLERDQTFDMVGEKLDAHCFRELHDEMKLKFPELSWVIAFAINTIKRRPYYHFVFEGTADDSAEIHLKNLLDQRFHYHLATELGQLSPFKLTITRDAFSKYEEYQIKKGMVQGNIKVELATAIKQDAHEEMYHEIFSG